MTEDPRCCGSGTCIIDPEGHCWCGQQWDGQRMAPPRPASAAACAPAMTTAAAAAAAPAPAPVPSADDTHS